MPYISWISPQEFLETIANLDTINLETIVVFPMEYYVLGDGITLYKQVMSKIYATRISINREDNTVIFNGKTVTFDVLVDDLKSNHNAKQLFKPLELGDNFTLQVSRV